MLGPLRSPVRDRLAALDLCAAGVGGLGARVLATLVLGLRTVRLP